MVGNSLSLSLTQILGKKDTLVQDCLARDAFKQVKEPKLPFAYCGYGELPCKYQGKLVTIAGKNNFQAYICNYERVVS